MGTDMHVAIEIKRPQYDYTSKSMKPTWEFVKGWTVDRCYDLFRCFNVRGEWSNSLDMYPACDLSRELEREKKDYCYGFYEIKHDNLKNNIIGWMPALEDWKDEWEDFDRPTINIEWLFDCYIYTGKGSPDDDDDNYKVDKLNYAIYKLMLRKYGMKNVRLIIYFDS